MAITQSYGISNLEVVGAILILMMRALSYGQSLAAALASTAAYLPFTLQVQEACQYFLANPAKSGSLMPVAAVPVSVANATYTYPNGRRGGRDSVYLSPVPCPS